MNKEQEDLTAITYSEAQGIAPFDWNHFLARTHQSPDEWGMARFRAGEWVTCACGNQCAVLERKANGEPIDNALSYLGMDFYDAIEDRNTEEAADILASIEKRSAQLISELAQS